MEALGAHVRHKTSARPMGGRIREHPSPEQEASSLEEWAVDGCRTPRWPRMLERLLDPYVHARGRLRSARPVNGNMLRFSQESPSLFGARMMCAKRSACFP